MRIFVLGAGATGSLLAQLLERQGHDVWCGDRNPLRARRFLGMKSTIAIASVNARNLRAIVRAAKGCDLIINASASVFNERVLRAALRLRARYLDLSSHLTRQPFKSEQLRYDKRFVEKNRAALFNAGAAPGLTNLLVKRAAELLDECIPSRFVFMKVVRALIPSPNGPRRFPTTKPSLNRAFTAIGNSSLQNASLNLRNSDFLTPSGTRA